MTYIVKKIELDIYTNDQEKAEGEGKVFLGCGGREFRLNIPNYTEFQRGAKDTFIIGSGSNISNGNGINNIINNENSFEINDKDILSFQKYIRYEPKDDNDEWNIDRIELRIYDASTNIQSTFRALSGNGDVWLGKKSGLIIGLK